MSSEREGYRLNDIVLNSKDRGDAYYNLNIARLILDRAAKKYAEQSSGGLSRALACVEKVLSSNCSLNSTP